MSPFRRLFCLFYLTSLSIFANSLTVDISYKDLYSKSINPEELLNYKENFTIPNFDGTQNIATHSVMDKVYIVHKIIKAFETALLSVEELSKGTDYPIEKDSCGEDTQRVFISEELLKEHEKIAKLLLKSPSMDKDGKIKGSLDLMERLAANIKKPKPAYRFLPYMTTSHIGGGVRTMARAKAAIPSANLKLKSGGAQDSGLFKRKIENGDVPKSLDFISQGFLNEFTFDGQSAKNCQNGLLCISPEFLVSADEKELYVLFNLDSTVSHEQFSRQALNLSIVLDISGSMSFSHSGDAKKAIEYAKDALHMSLDKLKANDMLSIVLFDHETQVFLEPTLFADIDLDALKKKIKEIRPRGATNLAQGLKEGYRLVESAQKKLNDKLYQNRVLLLTDANTNTGEVEKNSFLKLTRHYGENNIGLTTIGIASNFNQDLIESISNEHGGNYLFASKGSDLVRYIENFDFLVQPILSDFNANFSLNGISGDLLKLYGAKMPESSSAHIDIMNLKTLFFSPESQGGGAIIAVYKLY